MPPNTPPETMFIVEHEYTLPIPQYSSDPVVFPALPLFVCRHNLNTLNTYKVRCCKRLSSVCSLELFATIGSVPVFTWRVDCGKDYRLCSSISGWWVPFKSPILQVQNGPQFSWTGRGYVTMTDGQGQDWRGRCGDGQRSQEQSILDQDEQLARGLSQVCERTLGTSKGNKGPVPCKGANG